MKSEKNIPTRAAPPPPIKIDKNHEKKSVIPASELTLAKSVVPLTKSSSLGKKQDKRLNKKI